MQTTVAVADEVPHRFRIVPLRETRGAVPLLSESTARDPPASSQNGVLREWAAKLRHVRTKSTGSSLLSAKKALSASLDAPAPCAESVGRITVSTETIQRVDAIPDPARRKTVGWIQATALEAIKDVEDGQGARTTSRHTSIPAGRKRARSSTISEGAPGRRTTDGNALVASRARASDRLERDLGTRRHAIYAFPSRGDDAQFAGGTTDNIVAPSYFESPPPPLPKREPMDALGGSAQWSGVGTLKSALRPTRTVLGDLDVNVPLPQFVPAVDSTTYPARPAPPAVPFRVSLLPLNIKKKRDTIDEVIRAGLAAAAVTEDAEKRSLAIMSGLVREIDADIRSWNNISLHLVISS
ncbi:hypothetical protein SCP_0201590 [Sparassis crispa]|uniref:Uncharacterized protein n=1 Tax=Sparassis crispa TaxID=139825 RepID=A0A401G9W9_9APHY|nr:hypothetical protein SCP_0201590 [Sparassis crispa]GBE78962.1 hypothetical protein SCP_0201590 [Sparassis crispa]